MITIGSMRRALGQIIVLAPNGQRAVIKRHGEQFTLSLVMHPKRIRYGNVSDICDEANFYAKFGVFMSPGDSAVGLCVARKESPTYNHTPSTDFSQISNIQVDGFKHAATLLDY